MHEVPLYANRLSSTARWIATPSRTKVHRELREFGAAHGITVVDRQSRLTEADVKSLVVNRFDAIPNKLTCPMIAGKLTPIIRE